MDALIDNYGIYFPLAEKIDQLYEEQFFENSNLKMYFCAGVKNYRVILIFRPL